eukprot:s2889_g1.t1
MVNTETGGISEPNGGADVGGFGDDLFTSFSDDLNNLNAYLEETTDANGEPPLGDPYLEGGEPGVEGDSMCSPTTVASGFLHDALDSDYVQDLDGPSSSDGRKYNVDAALDVAFNSINAEQPKQVWETGIWKYIFGDNNAALDFDVWGPQTKRPSPALWGVEQLELISDDAEDKVKRRRTQGCNFMDVVSFKPDVPWKDQRESDLQRSINLWVAVTSRWDDNCSLVCKLDEMRSEGERFNMFAHVFSGRAPVTIRKRGGAILKICDYLEDKHLERFPMYELTFYRFLCSEHDAGAPASRLQGFLQAVTFCRHVLDVSELQCILDSKRCRGVGFEDCPKERKQASPLTVAELQRLHAIVEEASDSWDSIFAGAALLCCYCRGRWGDLMRSETAFLDYDEQWRPSFVETRTGRHKTMASQMHRHQYLPMVAPVKGVNGGDWATPWIKLRESMGIQFPPDGLIMPAPTSSMGRPHKGHWNLVNAASGLDVSWTWNLQQTIQVPDE